LPEGDVAAVVPLGGPLDDQALRTRVDAMRRPAVDRVSQHLDGRLAPQPDVDVAVASVVRVEGHPVGEAVDLEQLLGRRGALIIPGGQQLGGAGPVLEVAEDE
jgi:hypothetical protein